VSAGPDSRLFLDFSATAGVIEAFEDFPMVLVLTDSQNRFIRVNRAASVFLGRAERDLVGRFVSEFLTSECRDKMAADLDPESADTGSYEEHEWAFGRPDRTIVWGAVRTLRLKDGRDHTWLRFNVIEDVTASRLAAGGEANLHEDLRAAEQTQRRSQSVIDAAAAALPVTFTTVDRNLIFTSVAGGLEVAETSPEDFLGKHVSEVIEDPDTLHALRSALAGAQSTTRTLFKGKTYLTLHGPIRDQSGDIVGAVSVSSDVTAEVAAEAERARAAELALFLARHDGLTGIPGRSALVEHLGVISCSEQGGVALVLVDLDNFTLINEGLGHVVGDAVLLEVASRISDAFPGLMIARHDGDEFAVVAPSVTDLDQAFKLGERVQEALDAEVQVGQHVLRVTASMGVALQASGPASTLIGDAHSALAQAKGAGTNQIRLYDAEMRLQVQERLIIQNGLRVALGAGELHVAYQPIVTLAERRIIGAEALLRWNHPEWGYVSPAAFIPIAERTGLIAPIGRWVMDTACNDARALLRDYGLSISINVSVRQFSGGRFAEWVEDVLDRTGLPPSALTVEVTEGAFMDDITMIRAALQRLRSRGVRVAIDDFGTGYSSLARLEVLPVDMIKLDRAFVTEIDVRPAARRMAAAILQISAAIGAGIVAEGVETEAEAATLRDLGYELGQGYLLARPMPIEALTARLHDGAADASREM
jgi:diguanylate cyclase (GGDEF)-like protein/PAS domain S-box-containing protein